MLHPDNYWLPNLSPKQLEVFNSQTHNTLVCGPVMSGKSIGVEHRIIRHMWDTPGARFAAFAKTVKSAKHGGSYDDIVKLVIPEWQAADLRGENNKIKFGYTLEPKVDGATRTHTFQLRNRFGGSSEFYLFSLDYDDDVEEKVKNTRFSGVWFIELTNFSTRDVWAMTINRLRMPHLKPEQHMWIADTNPGNLANPEESWIYDLFYQKAGFCAKEDQWMIDQTQVIEIMLDDNPFLDATTINKIKATFRHDPEKYERYVEGRWNKSSENGHFSDVFDPKTHIQGDCNGLDPSNWNIIIPSEQTFELVSGWDPGDVNHSAHIAQVRVNGNMPVYDIIDELCVLDRKVSIKDFTQAFIELMDKWEKMMQDIYGRGKVSWRHWSDSSIFNFNAGLGSIPASTVYVESNKRIDLRPIAKPRGSIRDRVSITKRLLFENRLFVSAQLHHTIEMLQKLKRGKTVAEYVQDYGGHKHKFDSMSYIFTGEEPLQLFENQPQTQNDRRQLFTV